MQSTTAPYSRALSTTSYISTPGTHCPRHHPHRGYQGRLLTLFLLLAMTSTTADTSLNTWGKIACATLTTLTKNTKSTKPKPTTTNNTCKNLSSSAKNEKLQQKVRQLQQKSNTREWKFENCATRATTWTLSRNTASIPRIAKHLTQQHL